MMKTFLLSVIMAVSVSGHTIAQELYAKPVPCGGLPGLIVEFEKSDMYPLVGLGGISWLDDGTTQASVTIVVVDANGRFAVIEKNAQDFCLLSTGNVVEYNSEKLKELMD